MALYVKQCIVVALLLINLQDYYEAVIFEGGMGIAGAAAIYEAAMNWARCHFKECCTDRWTRPETKDKKIFLDIFKRKLIGQHLVTQIVPKAIHNHIFDDHPKKALVLSFHGWTGCGKNFVADFVTEYIYREGLSSVYVHTKIAPEHYPDPNKITEYKAELRSFIKEQTKACGRSIFIFDEFGKMPAGLADVLKTYIDFHQKVDGVDYRKNIFIFLNNVGGDEIKEVTLENFRNGNAREDITTSAMEQILSLSSLKLHGGFQGSELILSGLVDFFVPFLPMERLHVKQCISVEIDRRLNDTPEYVMSRDHRKDIVDKVTNELQYYPIGENIFSTSGCKQVAKKVDMFF